MSETTTQTASPPAVSRSAVRIVLFGMPAAGKTSLLGALGEAAQTQEHLLNGRLADLTQGLAELRQRLYEESPRRTVEEIVPYPIVYEPFVPDDGGPRRLEGVLIDCDGRVANDLLVRRKSLEADSAEGTLAREVFLADTLVLVIDASAPAAQVDADFAEFGRFLRLLERSRGQQAEVGGLPVFLVLTKCDLLAMANDRALDWMERIEDRKRQVDRRFQDFLKRKEEESGPLPFGRLDLHLWATAVKRPALAESPAKPREPYAVAELFRQCFHAAHEFHQRRRHSSRRLFWTVAGAAGLVAVLLLTLVVVATQTARTNPAQTLQTTLDTLRAEDEGQTPSQRLRGRPEQLQRRIAVLREIRNDPHFPALSAEARDYVETRLKELQEYHGYYEKLLMAPPPAEARNPAELQKSEEALKTALAVPRDEWSETEAARLRDDRLKDARALRDAVRTAQGWYQEMRERGEELWTFARRQPGTGGASLDWRVWQADVKRLWDSAQSPPFRESDRLRGNGSPAWRDTVLRFEPVVEARVAWEQTRQKLERLLNLSAALGLGLMPERPPLLVFAQGTFSAQDAAARLRELKQSYPKYDEHFRPTHLPEAAAPDVRQAARANYANLLESGREAVLRRLQQAGSDDRETPPRWQAVQRWLQAGPQELAEWRVLATTLRRLAEPEAVEPDPVAELASFLTRDRFDISIRRLSVRIPLDLRITPGDTLTLHHVSGGTERTVTLKRSGEAEPDRPAGVTTYSFRVADEGNLVYRPGDALWATLPVTKEGADSGWALTWAKGRSEVYQQEHLLRGAVLHEADKLAEGKYVENVRLLPGGDTRIPPVPDLVPVVRLTR